MLIDFGRPLLFMIPLLQRVLSLPLQLEFSIKYSPDNIQETLEGVRWLHAGISLQENGAIVGSSLLCYPASKMLKVRLQD